MNLSSILNLLKKQQNQKVSLDYSQKRDSSSGTEKTFNSEQLTKQLLTIVGLKAATNKESVQAQHKISINSIIYTNFLNLKLG